jgi:hypothetical protein
MHRLVENGITKKYTASRQGCNHSIDGGTFLRNAMEILGWIASTKRCIPNGMQMRITMN